MSSSNNYPQKHPLGHSVSTPAPSSRTGGHAAMSPWFRTPTYTQQQQQAKQQQKLIQQNPLPTKPNMSKPWKPLTNNNALSSTTNTISNNNNNNNSNNSYDLLTSKFNTLGVSSNSNILSSNNSNSNSSSSSNINSSNSNSNHSNSNNNNNSNIVNNSSNTSLDHGGNAKSKSGEEVISEVDELSLVCAEPTIPFKSIGTHTIYTPFSLWYTKRVVGQRTQSTFHQNLIVLGHLHTVEDFWAFHTHMKRPDELQDVSDLHLFRKGVKPMWEDPSNKVGGKWIVRLRKGLAARLWEGLALGVIGNQFEVGDDEICGLVLSIRYNEDILALWNRNASDPIITNKIKEGIRKVLSFPTSVIMEYKCHDKSLKDLSSFRNTDVFR